MFSIAREDLIRCGDFRLGSLIRDNISGVIFIVYNMKEGETYVNSELMPLDNHKLVVLSFSLDKKRESHYSNYRVLQY